MNKSCLLSINKHSNLKERSLVAFVAGIIKTSCKSFETCDSQLRTDFDSKYFTMSARQYLHVFCHFQNLLNEPVVDCLDS